MRNAAGATPGSLRPGSRSPARCSLQSARAGVAIRVGEPDHAFPGSSAHLFGAASSGQRWRPYRTLAEGAFSTQPVIARRYRR
jgi:hypothetical protein